MARVMDKGLDMMCVLIFCIDLGIVEYLKIFVVRQNLIFFMLYIV